LVFGRYRVLAPSAGKDAASPQDACKDLVGALSLAKRHYQFGITKLFLKGGQVTTAHFLCVVCAAQKEEADGCDCVTDCCAGAETRRKAERGCAQDPEDVARLQGLPPLPQHPARGRASTNMYASIATLTTHDTAPPYKKD
jgi:hypothetical protein